MLIGPPQLASKTANASGVGSQVVEPLLVDVVGVDPRPGRLRQPGSVRLPGRRLVDAVFGQDSLGFADQERAKGQRRLAAEFGAESCRRGILAAKRSRLPTGQQIADVPGQ